MATRKYGDKFSIFAQNGKAYVYTWIGGKRYREALGCKFSDKDECEARARERWQDLKRKANPTRGFDSLIDAWLDWIKETRPRSERMFVDHSRAFKKSTVDFFERDAPQAYANWRIKNVIRATVRKELSSLTNFYSWAVSAGHITSAPVKAVLPRALIGKRSGPQRSEPVAITMDEARAIIAALPSGKVRDFTIFAYETSLRPITIAQIEVPTHWRKGSQFLRIDDDMDKANFGRTVPLSETAVAILERYAPPKGIVFGTHNFRASLKAAARKVLDAYRAERFSRYDYRHASISHTIDLTQDMRGAGFQAGHKQMTTTNRYAKPTLAEGKRVMEKIRETGGLSGTFSASREPSNPTK